MSNKTSTEAIDYLALIRIVESALEFGIIRYVMLTNTVHLDEAAAILHGRGASECRALALRDWANLLVEEDRLAACSLMALIPKPDETTRITVRLAELDRKNPRFLELSLRWSGIGDGESVGACRDITRERSNEELRRQKLAAERANRAKSDFMSQVSHELRTPLNAILGFSQIMAMDRQQPLAAEHLSRLEMIWHSGKRLLGLIDQLLQINKIERGKSTLRAKSVNVQRIVGHCVDALEAKARKRGIKISVDIERPERSSVRADPDALERVVTNLLSNAIKYNHDQGQVLISFRASKRGEITVDDTGQGISDSQLSRMFEPFERLGAERSAVPGTGLGLTISKQLVEAMNGKLDVWSEVGKGSRFRIQLPLARATHDSESRAVPLDLPSQWESDENYLVLYVEDDEVNVILMEQLFASHADWQLRCAATGSEGLAMARRELPHLILLDMNLPDMGGPEVFQRLRADPATCSVPCVAVSADARPYHIARVLAMGFQDYWTKPLDLPTTLGKLKQMLR